MTLQDILKPNKTRKIVIFGTGGLAKNIFTHLAGFEIAYFVDNNSSKWGGNFLGLSINNPNVLVNEPRGSVIVLIASSFVIEIEVQLQSLGFLVQEDIIDCNYISYTAAGEYYSPLPSIENIRNKKNVTVSNSPALLGINFNDTEQINLLEDLYKYKHLFPYKNNPTNLTLRYPKEYNGFFDFSDAMPLFCIMNKYQPKCIIEVGSGFSSALMLDVNDHFLKNTVDFIFIEPYPERLNALLTDKDKDIVTIYERKLQDIPISCFDRLASGDILFIDSSHVVKFESDVNWLFNEVIPRLKHGVIVHFHDIEYPFEYPLKWLQEGRAWNEAYMLRSFLQYNNIYKILYWNSYLGVNHKVEVNKFFPEYCGGNSIWLRKIDI